MIEIPLLDPGEGDRIVPKKRPFKKKPVPVGQLYYVAWQDEFDLHHNAVRAITITEAGEIFRRKYPARKVLGLSLEYPSR
jgi:hypothetical protein